MGIDNDEKNQNYIYHMIREVQTINDLRLDTSHKAILFCMESCGNSIFPSLRTFSKWVGCSVSTVQRKLSDLEKHKIIRRIRRSEKSNIYKLFRGQIKTHYYDEIEERKEKKRRSGYIELEFNENMPIDFFE